MRILSHTSTARVVLTMAQEIYADRTPVLAFGPFRLLPEQKVLYRAGKPLRLGSRAKEILFTLVERAGETVKKSELMARVWPDIVVEDGALRVHIFALRKALGGEVPGIPYVETINGHGYRLNARIQRVSNSAAASSPEPGEGPTLIGRERELASVLSKLQQNRLVTLVGPPGVGKSSLAGAAVEELRGAYASGVRSIDIAAIDDPAQVAAIAEQVMQSVFSRGATASALVSERMLLLLDNCDHMIEATAALAEHLFNTTKHIDVLVTGREPLHAFGESLIRLHPLALPTETSAASADGALTSAAVRLFVERAVASDDRFRLSDGNLSQVLEICRKLDGLPLAIELAAAHVGTLGVAGLAALADEPLCVLSHRRRTAAPRHRSLRAALEWSFVRLSEDERKLLGLLVEKDGDFDFADATSLLCGDMSHSRAAELFTGLAEKSLIVPAATDRGNVSRFRVLSTTRACVKT